MHNVPYSPGRATHTHIHTYLEFPTNENARQALEPVNLIRDNLISFRSLFYAILDDDGDSDGDGGFGAMYITYVQCSICHVYCLLDSGRLCEMQNFQH